MAQEPEAAQVPAVESETAAPAAEIPAAETPAPIAEVPSAEPVATPAETTSSVETPAVPAEPVAVAESVEEPAKDSSQAVAPQASQDSASGTKQGVPQLSNEKVAKMLNSRPSYPRFYPGGLYLRSSYAPSNGVDIGAGFLFPLSESWPVSVGFEPFHLQIGADDFQIVSDETLWIAAAGLVLGAMGPLFKDDNSNAKDSTAKESEEESGGVLGTVLAITTLVPLYAICGYLYIPVVPGSWLGIVDRSRLITQLISEGFHKRSFTYMNDLGLRLSPLASRNGIAHGYLDGGIRFEKNFDADLKYHYFAQLGVSLSF